MALFPLFVELEGRPCVVLGGGAVAERKVAALLDAGAVVTVVSPVLSPALGALVSSGRIAHVARRYADGDLADAVLAFAATDDGKVNDEIAREGRARGVWVNAADDPAHCDAILPAVFHRGAITVAVSTGGASPALARAVRERLEDALPEAYGPLAEVAATARRELRAAGHRASAQDWLAAIDDGLGALLDGASREEAARRLRARLERAACA
jgi:siroheme synthase-like protein